MGRGISTNGRPAITIIGIGQMGINAISMLSRVQLLNVKCVGITVDGRRPNGMAAVSLAGCDYPTTVRIFERLIKGTDFLIAVYDSHDGFIASRSQILATVARDLGVMAVALVREPYLYGKHLNLDETAYVTVFPISEQVLSDYYIMNVVKAIVNPMTLDGLCGFDLADTKSILQKGKVGYGGFGIDRGGIEKAAIMSIGIEN
jgi:cell division GTPase FtsZ